MSNNCDKCGSSLIVNGEFDGYAYDIPSNRSTGWQCHDCCFESEEKAAIRPAEEAIRKEMKILKEGLANYVEAEIAQMRVRALCNAINNSSDPKVRDYLNKELEQELKWKSR